MASVAGSHSTVAGFQGCKPDRDDDDDDDDDGGSDDDDDDDRYRMREYSYHKQADGQAVRSLTHHRRMLSEVVSV